MARAYGFEGIDVGIGPEDEPARIADLLAQYGLKPGGAGLPVDYRGDEATLEAGLEVLAKIAPKAAAVRVTRFSTWILSFSDTLPMAENMRVHAERLGKAAKILAESGCRLGLEFLGPKTLRVGHKYPFVRTMEGMLELCAMTGPNVGLLLDSWHWYTSLGTVEDILALAPEQVVYVHINDAPAGIPVDKQVDSVRCLPGATGVIDLAGFLGALRTIRYDGPVVPEPFVPALAQLPPAEAAKQVGEALEKVWALPVSMTT